MKHQLTPRQMQAINWVKASYGRRWRKRLQDRPEDLPMGYKHCYYKPFGIPEWNEHIRIARRVLWQGKI